MLQWRDYYCPIAKASCPDAACSQCYDARETCHTFTGSRHVCLHWPPTAVVLTLDSNSWSQSVPDFLFGKQSLSRHFHWWQHCCNQSSQHNKGPQVVKFTLLFLQKMFFRRNSYHYDLDLWNTDCNCNKDFWRNVITWQSSKLKWEISQAIWLYLWASDFPLLNTFMFAFVSML